MPENSKLSPAHIEWKQDTPVSTTFDDMYFNVQAGLAESRHVFLQGNQLETRFRQLSENTFTIAETGFGTGLNFLAARELWLKTAPADAQLHFISVEKHPLRKDDLQQALSHWPELNSGSTQLIERYPLPVPGFHRLRLDGGRVNLTLMLMDAAEAYAQMSATVDAWFLDGFAPSKNPEMWNSALFSQIGRLSAPGTTLATFTAAGFVRRGLQDVGFEIAKVPGFGQKREMVTALFRTDGNSATGEYASETPWYDRPESTTRPEEIIVIGAGVAGCATARAFAERGIKVTLLERNPEIAQEGSGNRQGALYAKLPVSHNTQGQLHLSGLLYSDRLLREADPDRSFWSDCGLLQLAANDKELDRQQALIEKTQFDASIVQAIAHDEASALAGMEVGAPGLYMPKGGWVAPQELCAYLLKHPLVELRCNTQVHSLAQNPDDLSWQVQLAEGNPITAGTVILCTAAETKQLNQTAYLPIKPIRGQTTIAAADKQLNTVVCADGYVSPSREGQYCFGATFDLHDLSLEVRTEDHDKNLAKLRNSVPTLADEIDTAKLEGKTAYRCSTADYLPITGGVPDYEAFVEDYAKLRVDRKWKFDSAPPQHLKGLYINVGHGSKGLITAPLCGEVLAALICNEPAPVEKELLDALNPARFIIKNLIRKTI